MFKEILKPMLGTDVRLLICLLFVNTNFGAILERRRGRVARSATPERSGGSPAEAEKSPQNFAAWGDQAAFRFASCQAFGVMLPSAE